MTTTAAAHIITAEAEALGTPEIIIMTRDDGAGAHVIERHDLNPDRTMPVALVELLDRGWRGIGLPTYIETGYVIFDVERI